MDIRGRLLERGASNESGMVVNGDFRFFRSLYLPYEVAHWLYISNFTRLRAVSLRQHGFCYVYDEKPTHTPFYRNNYSHSIQPV